MSEKKLSDYIGFTFNKVHSSELGIVRISEGSRFNEGLLPPIKDVTVQIPGGDGEYFFSTCFDKKVFDIKYAFDSLTEAQIAKIKQTFGDKKIHDLIFDELPYKIYSAKVTGTAQIKYIPFSEGETNRVYKGEGSVQFTAFTPYARCEKKFLDEYKDLNKNEWSAAAGFKNTNPITENDSIEENNGRYRYDFIRKFAGEDEDHGGFWHYVKTLNPGDLESDFKIRLFFKDGEIPEGRICLKSYEKDLAFNKIQAMEDDVSVVFDSKSQLIEGYDVNGAKTGNIYNACLWRDRFFKIPTGEATVFFSEAIIEYLYSDSTSEQNGLKTYPYPYPSIQYNLYYF